MFGSVQNLISRKPVESFISFDQLDFTNYITPYNTGISQHTIRLLIIYFYGPRNLYEYFLQGNIILTVQTISS